MEEILEEFTGFFGYATLGAPPLAVLGGSGPGRSGPIPRTKGKSRWSESLTIMMDRHNCGNTVRLLEQV
jgi:hypothetical protein